MKKQPKKTKPKRPQCPSHIAGEAKAEWDRVCDTLADAGLLDESDRAILALYCAAWSKWVEAESKVAAMGLMVAAPKTRLPMVNPYLAIAATAHGQLVRLLSEMGLTPTSRSKAEPKTAAPRTETADKEPDIEPECWNIPAPQGTPLA